MRNLLLVLLTFTAFISCSQKQLPVPEQELPALTPEVQSKIVETTKKVKDSLEGANFHIKKIADSYTIRSDDVLRMPVRERDKVKLKALKRIMLGGKMYFWFGPGIAEQAYFPNFKGDDYIFTVHPIHNTLSVSIKNIGTATFTSNMFGDLKPVLVVPQKVDFP